MEMNITFLIGNGFDIELGLETRFSDFFKQLSPEKIATNQIYEKIHVSPDEWSDFELALGKYTFKLGDDYRKLSSEEEKRELIKTFLENLENVKLDLGDYIEKEELEFKKLGKKFESPKKYMDNLFNDLLPTENVVFRNVFAGTLDNDYNFSAISFNYTSLFDEAMKPLEEAFEWQPFQKIRKGIFGEIVHIHGTFTRFLTLGVNDLKQIDSELFEDDEIYQLVKPYDVIETREDRDGLAIRKISDSQIIVIYGMSLGETDKKWWQHICEWLAKNKSNLLIIHAFDADFSSVRISSKLVKLRQNIVKSFLDYYEGEKEYLKEQIFLLVNNKIFFPQKDLKDAEIPILEKEIN